jgi:hypothetical protein
VYDQAVTSAYATVAGMISGSRLYIYNVSTSASKLNEIIPSDMYYLSYANGTEYTAGDNIQVRIVAPVGATTYLQKEYNTQATAGGWTVLFEAADDTVYNNGGVDGTTVTEFDADYPNIQVDIDDPDGETTVQRLYAWYTANTFTSGGVADYFGGMIGEDSANYKIITDIVDLKLDNIATSPLMIIGGRLYRDDATTVITSGSNSIQMDPSKAYLANSTDIATDLNTIKKKTGLIPALL